MNTPFSITRQIDASLPARPLLRASEVAEALGYSTAGALAKARQTGRLQVRMFEIPGRRGWFAARSDVLDYLVKMVTQAHTASDSDEHHSS